MVSREPAGSTPLQSVRFEGAYRRKATYGLSWFKPTAAVHIAKVFDLVALLADHGYRIDVIKSDKPGYVIYEDDFQIIAEPFADTRVG